MTTGDLVIAADFGTSGVKVGAVDRDLTLRARVVETYPLDLGPGGHAEQAPADWWWALARAIARLTDEIPDLPQRAGALSFGSQICGVVCVGEDGAPLRPCLTWLDKRAAPLGRALVGGAPQVHGYQIGKLLRWLRIANGAPAKNGMDPTAKFLWIKREEPEVFARTRWFMDVKDWLVLRATGRPITTAESANLTWLMDTRRGREGWSPRLAAMTGIPLDKLPEIADGADVVGTLTTGAAADLGLPAGLPVMGGVSDVTAAALGSGEVEDGALHICIATSAWISGFFPNRRLNVPASYATITSSVGFRPLLIASQENAGSALEWAVKMTGGAETTETLATAFAQVGEARPNDPYFLPWLAGERVPVDDDALRGVLHGLRLHHGPPEIRRAAIEGVALNIRWAYSKVAREKGVRLEGPISMVGGVAANPRFAQTLADALHRPLRVGEARHAGVLGAAALAAPVLGWSATVWEAAARLRGKTTATYTPDPDRAAALDARNAQLAVIRRNAIRSFSRTRTRS
ncbi:xylulokinase [Salinihabitans flavidus]|uniref:Xylulokinase n=1 Tax=Salinihabitans flavidus TaxID=569882 RepID=A0A1H8LDJ7_9RHOB|nr:xylulokinase [Salinihabitans flavidus]